MTRFGVISDDLTGACDVGIQFRKRGLKTLVLANLGALAKVRDFDTVVIDIDTRNDSSDTAYNKARAGAKALKEIGVALVYKKMDSTLRGNIGAELDAIMDELDFKAVVIAPAFPAANRTTLGGRQLLNGVPLDKTDFAHDPVNPVKESHIPTLMQGQTHKKIGIVNLPKVREGIESLTHQVETLIRSGKEMLIIDAETKDDLNAIAKATLDSKVLPCGSAGLAEQLSHWLVLSLAEPRLLIVSGSVNIITLNQISAVKKALNVRILHPNLSLVLAGEENRRTEADRLVKDAKKAVETGRDIVISLAQSKDEISRIQQLGTRLGMDHHESAGNILSFLGEVSSATIDTCKIERIVLVGGDTAIHVVNALGAYGIKIEDEVLPGIPLGRILGGRFDGLLIVTKAGGFGHEDALIEVIKKLRNL